MRSWSFAVFAAATALAMHPAALLGQAVSAEEVRVAPAGTYVARHRDRQELALRVQTTVRTRLESSEPIEAGERKVLLDAERAAGLTLGQWERAIALTRAIRALEPKPANQVLEGLVFESIARASRNASYSSRKFAQSLSAALERLNGRNLVSSLRGLRTAYFLMSRNSVLAQIEGPIAANIAARSGAIDVQLASDLLEQLFILDRVVPELGLINNLFAERLARTDMQLHDLWSPRQVTLSPTLPLSKVIVGIWDTGVDTELFQGRLWTNPREEPNGIDDDGNGFVDDIHGFAFNPNRQPSTGALGDQPGGSSEGFDRLARYSVGWADLDAGEVTEDALFARSVAQSLSAAHRAAFNLDLNRLSFFTHGTGITSIAVAGNPAAEIMIGRIANPVGQVPPPIDEADAAARVAYADRAIAYFKKNGARVVNMSFRLTLPNVEASLASIEPDPVRRRKRAEKIYSELHEGFERAIRSAPEILFIAGAGNSNENNDQVRSFPAGIEADNLIAVGAVDAQLEPADITSFGRSVDMYALGVSVPQKLVGGRIIRFTGTSSATPQVTNLAAKLLALCPSLSAADLKAAILGTATSEGSQMLRVMHPRAAIQSAPNCSQSRISI